MHVATLQVGRASYALAFFLSLFGVSLAHADSLTLLWDPNQGTVNGYAVYVGSSRVDVGNTTSYTMTTAVAGQRYCFAVAAYNFDGRRTEVRSGVRIQQRIPYAHESGQSVLEGRAGGVAAAGGEPIPTECRSPTRPPVSRRDSSSVLPRGSSRGRRRRREPTQLRPKCPTACSCPCR